ncbi:MAG TPA: serine/threonine-protein kinase [Candidatus Thermoplasmatota archaeon]|nr:serine/threonine-protein kinase [Candidatus Thermoplasmatota archaeon]
MGLAWNWYAAPATLGAAVSLLFAVIVLAARPRSPQNRALAGFLVAEALSIFGLNGGAYLMGSAASAGALHLFGALWLGAKPYFYVRFLSTLDTPLARPLRSPLVRHGLLGVWLLQMGAVVLAPQLFLAGVVPHPDVRWSTTIGPIMPYIGLSLPLIYIAGIGVVYSAWRRAVSGISRTRAKILLVAFASRDAYFLAWGISLNALPLDHPLWHEMFVSGGLLPLTFVPLAGYGVLRAQLFDIDLRLKTTLSRGAVAGVFVFAYVLVSQLAGALLTPKVGVAVGVASTTVLLLAVLPLHRAVERAADRLLPGVRPEPSYVSARKLEVYRAALEELVGPDGRIGAREAAQLERLRGSLGLTERDHALLAFGLAGGRLPARAELVPGRLVAGRYRLERPLGDASRARAWAARDERADAVVVVKDVGEATPGRPPVERAALDAVRHPCVVRVLDALEVDGRQLLVMEHVAGGTLAERLRRGPLARAELARVGADLLDALAAAHANGVLHRDVKPSNVLLTPDGHARLADFGVARVRGLEETLGPDDGWGAPSVVGTPRYMAPEQARGREATRASDLYAAGATLYEAATGSPYLHVIADETREELQQRAARMRPFARRVPGAPELEPLFARALAPEPAERYASATEMRDALLAALRPALPTAPLAA